MLKSKCIVLTVVMLISLTLLNLQSPMSFAQTNELVIYKIYNEFGTLLFEEEDVSIGDEYLNKDFHKYEVVSINHKLKIGRAKFVGVVEKPKVDISYTPKQISVNDPKICLYMSHNDESYVPTDGTESVYGAGGIHDVAKALRNSFEKYGVTTYIDETLHIPHDTKAYARSSATVNNLINKYSPNALFDIHRDGSSRSSYVTKVGGTEKCRVRIVVGKASSNYKDAEKLALYLLAVGEELYDWLFLDIYYATGHYNQGIAPKMLLFEMGCHMVEKELVMQSVDPLAHVVTTALFNTTVNKETGDLTINGAVDDNNIVIDQSFDDTNDGSFVLSIILAGFVVFGVVKLIGLIKRRK